jgi:hypothetical protein
MKRKTIGGLSPARQGMSLGKPMAAILLLGVLFVVGTSSLAHGQELQTDRVTLRGFGTFAATTHDAEDIEFRRNTGQGRALEGNTVGLFTDSVAGVQVNLRAGRDFDVVLQGVTRMTYEGDFKPAVSQAFVRYSPDDALVMRAGRIGIDIYLLAESRQVGYSYVPLRPSTEFYGLLANDAIDGADVAYTRRVGRGLLRGRLFAGGGSDEMAFSDRTHLSVDSEVLGACLDFNYGGWTARAAVGRWKYDTDPGVSDLVAGLRMTGAPLALGVADDLDQPTFQSRGVQLGVAYDDGPLQAQLLWGGVDSDPIFGPDTSAVYVFGGYRLRKWTPFASFSRSRDRASMRTTGLPDIPQLAPLNDAVAWMQSSVRTTQHTASLGVRYDIAAHFDLKFQLDRVKIIDSALAFDRRPVNGGDVHMTVAAVAVDFVF